MTYSPAKEMHKALDKINGRLAPLGFPLWEIRTVSPRGVYAPTRRYQIFQGDQPVSKNIMLMVQLVPFLQGALAMFESLEK